MTLAITFKVLATGSQNVSGLIYDYSGSSYHYNDDGGSEPNLLTVTAAYGPTAPDAANDSVTTNEDTSVDINFLANDTDVNGNLNASSLSVATQPSNGTASFTYEVCDVPGLCDTAVVDITVNSVNDGPNAVDDSATTPEDTRGHPGHDQRAWQRHRSGR